MTSLDLSNQGLQSGGLNHAIFDLTSLEYLNLAYNDFNGSSLPSTGFERLVKLTHLNLSSSDFDGQVPIGIRQLTNLVSLDLSTGFEIIDLLADGYRVNVHSNRDSRLTHPNFEALIAKLGKLRKLNLGYVDLSGNEVRWCDALARSTPKLQLLSLPFCRLSGPICTSLSSLHSLAIIDLQHNHLSGPLPDFLTNFSNLRVLQLQRNNLEGWLSPIIFELKKLVTINIYHNFGLSGYLPNFSTSNSLEHLDVSRTNFSGTIPSSVSNLKSLKRLGLGAPGFFGELPTSIGKLKSLSVLQISGLGLAGSIPSWVANLTSLEILQFSECGLSGSIPPFIGEFKKLERLILCNCSFSGKIPSHISNLTQLQILMLYSNHLFGTVELTFLKKLPHLDVFEVSNNNLVVVDGKGNSSLASYPKISILGLSECNISKFPNFLRHQSQMSTLDLSYNQMHGAIPQWAWEVGTDFVLFILANNKFTGTSYTPLLPFSVLVLDLSNNMFEGPIPIPRGSASVLDYSNNKFSSAPSNFGSHLSDTILLMASQNNFSGDIPSFFCGATSIQLLDLSYNNFNGSIPPCVMSKVNGMQSLNLRQNKLHGEFPDNINEGCSLEALDFSGNWIEGQLPRSLVACKNLELFDVGNNQISDSFPCWMSVLHRLEVLVLKSNRLFGHVAQSLAEEKTTCAFPSLRIVDLSSNNFSGPLPQDQWFKELKSMIVRGSNTTLIMDHGLKQTTHTYTYTTAVTYKGHDTSFAKILRTLVFIDVSNNAFHGGIPEAIWELVLLHGLNLSHNFLTGMIPSQVGHLDQLEALDMSSNELSGVIPRELASLDFLTMVNLSYNKLEGRIPESPHFSTFLGNSFLGNDGLCGTPLPKECKNTTTPNVVTHASKENSLDIMLFLFVGLGFGVGFAAIIVATWILPIKRKS